MRQPKTYGDHLTLVALSRELNCQFLILNSEGIDHTRLVSNDGEYAEDIACFTLGYFPENIGEHFVSLGLEESYKQRLLRTFHNETGSSVTETDIRMHEIEIEDQSRQHEDDNTNESAHSINREPEPTETESDTIDTPENGIESEPREINHIDEESVDLSLERPYLPNEILREIVMVTISLYPYMRYTLQRVSLYFAEVVRSIGYRRMLLSPSLMPTVPRPVSVARLRRKFGRRSGVMLGVRSLLRFAGPRWRYAWLWFYAIGDNWYELRDVTWQ
ncbi:hypothetical protein DPMN_150777 [Dreissena polymorpha]|uniref:Uncharacterized protein n=1 Tax=Dreissena polymorpha TaxID=45954 RepID=A0A9D4FIB3_DREPO|nr:hypothetical protein DPMN_150777 [Dreissena polymorpha]